ncbi:MAG: hypothetical protein ACLQVI_36535 [Polyangiaceae bacterium]
MTDATLTALRLPVARLARTPRAWIPVAAWGVLAIVSAVALRGSGSGATTSALESIFGGLALPFLSFAIVGAVLGGDGLARSTRPFVAFGAPPASVALATTAVAVAASALLSGALGAAVVALAHGASDPPLGRDMLTSAWVAGLGGAAYASLFSFGASFGRRGGGRAVALMVDWVLGSGTGGAALVTPRAHVRSLLGGDPVERLSGHASALVLVALVALFAALAAARTRRA